MLISRNTLCYIFVPPTYPLPFLAMHHANKVTLSEEGKNKFTKKNLYHLFTIFGWSTLIVTMIIDNGLMIGEVSLQTSHTFCTTDASWES